MALDWKKIIKKRLERKVFTGLPLTIFVTVFLILLGTFLGITDSIVNSLPMVKLDASFAHFLFQIRTPSLAKAFYVITNFADQITIAVIMIISLGYLFWKKELAYLYALLLTFIGTEGSVFLIKIFINRDRPGADIAYYLETSKSFPSGHSAIAMAIFGFITNYVLHHIASYKNKSLVIFAGSILIALIGFSRLYLGVHFLSDVIGGFLIGGLWLVAGITFRERHFYVDSLKKGKTA
ncbi:MAG: phosphatase PAP2 family protein [Patescibacteria group bacterium]